MNPGDVLGGRYEILRELGRGGMGVVVLAHDRDLERDVAVKAMRPEYAADADLVGRFRREGLALARLRHPSIVRVYDILEPGDGALYLVMEHVPGETLDRILARGPLPWPECVRIGVQVCEALGAAHAAGVVHRDVKPGNVIVEPDGMARVTDLGLAQLVGQTGATRSGQFIGTPEYWAPEQALGQELTAATDQYSTAVMLFEAATGERPYASDGTPGAVAFMHVMSPVPDPRPLAPAMSDAGAAALMRGMSKEPAERYASMGEFGAALRASLPAGADVPAATQGLAAAVEGGTALAEPAVETVAAGPYSPAPVGVDLTRPVVMPDTRVQATGPRRGIVLACAGGAFAVAALAGVLLGRGGGDDGGTARVAAPAFTMPVPAGWSRAAVAPAVPGLALRDAVALVPDSGGGRVALVAGTTGAEGPTLLPEPLRARLASSPRAGAVGLASSVEALRYDALRVDGLDDSRLRVVTVPTSRGTVTVACVTPPADAALADCDASAAGLALRGARAFPLVMSAAQAGALDAALRPLRASRAAGRGAIDAAADAATVATGAERVRGAYATAAERVEALRLGPMHGPARAALASSLRGAAGAYDRLAASARTGSGYAAARSRVAAAERAVDADVDSLTAVAPPLTDGG